VGLGIWELIRVSVTGFRFCLFRESETPFPPPAPPKSRSIRGRAARESGQARPPSRPRRGERLRAPGALDPGPRRVVSERGFTYGPGPSTAASTPGARASKRAGGRFGPRVLGPSRALRAGGAHISSRSRSRSRQPLVFGVRGPPASQGAGGRDGVGFRVAAVRLVVVRGNPTAHRAVRRRPPVVWIVPVSTGLLGRDWWEWDKIRLDAIPRHFSKLYRTLSLFFHAEKQPFVVLGRVYRERKR
jgi:hypothetical protein